MNRHLYRIVFNAARGVCMAVQETARGAGKSTSGASAPVLRVSTRVLAGMLAVGVQVLLPPPTAFAQIAVNPSAPGSQRPTILVAPNGVPLVNITTPSAAGVSLNGYSQFDIQTDGAILNNSRSNVQTQLGGWVQGNPWLANGSAKIIVNQIENPRPTQLNGYTEVAGQRAEVVIANTNGIQVNGGGFINASGTTLTTGTPRFSSSGALQGFTVNDGTVNVTGQGLDASTTDYAAILARNVELNAGVWAKQLEVVAGASQINMDPDSGDSQIDGQIEPANPAGATSDFALDVSTLGGMYANAITLVGTEAGLGVRNAGNIGANAGNLIVTANGQLVNSGHMQASDLIIATSGDLSNDNGVLVGETTTTLVADGTLRNNAGVVAAGSDLVIHATDIDSTDPSSLIRSAGNINLSIAGMLTTEGRLTAQGNTTIRAGKIHAGSTSVLGAGINSDGSLAETGNLNAITSEELSARGQNVAAGDLDLHGMSVDISDAYGSAGNIGIIADQGDINSSGATVTTSGNLNIAATEGALINTGGLLVADRNADIHSASLDNAQGTLASTGVLNIRSGTLANDAGRIQSGAALNIATNGQALTNTNAASYIATGESAPVAGNPGGIVSAGTLNIASGDLDNRGGLIAAHDTLTVITANVNNAAGTIASHSTLDIKTRGGDYNNSASGQTLSVGDLSLDVDAGNVNNAGGIIASTGTLAPDGAAPLGGNATLTSAGVINNVGGTLSAGDTLQLLDTHAANTLGGVGASSTSRSMSIINTDGTLAANHQITVDGASAMVGGILATGGDITVVATQDISIDATGQIQADNNLTLETRGDLNNSGSLGAGSELTVHAGSINNSAYGQIVSGGGANNGATRLLADDTLTNRGLVDGDTTRITASTVNNLGTGRIYGDQLSIAAASMTNDAEMADGINRAGTIAARSQLDLGVGMLNNRNGAMLYSGGDINIGATLDTDGRAQETAGAINNVAATMQAARDMTITANTIDNDNGGVTYTMVDGPSIHTVQYARQGDATRYDSNEVLFTTYSRSIFGGWASLRSAPNHNPPTAYAATPLGGELMIPLPQYPLETFRPYYLKSPASSAGYDSIFCTGGGNAQTCATRVPGAYYAVTDPIWTTFGVQPPIEQLPADFPLILDPNATVGQTTYWQDSISVPFPTGPVTQEQIDLYNNWKQANAELDKAIQTFVKAVGNSTTDKWNVWVYDTATSTPILESSSPGRILSGGAMNLNVNSATNTASQILAGGTLSALGESISNQDVYADAITTETGSTGFSRPKSHLFQGTNRHWQDYVPINKSSRTSIPIVAAIEQGNYQVDAQPVIPDRQVLEPSGQDAASVIPSNRVAPIVQIDDAVGSGVIRTTTPTLSLPIASLYQIQPDVSSSFLIETDPQFANYRDWLSSSYLIGQLGLDPAATQKRLGDGYYEQQLVNQQVAQLTGYSYLAGHDSSTEQYAALMNAGATFAKEYNLTLGVALTPAQMAQLTSDIVWLVNKPVTLADGSVQNVLVPQVYARIQADDLDGSGALLSGTDVNLDLTSDLFNSGNIAGRRVVALTAENIDNLNGLIAGQDIDIVARNDLNHIGGTAAAENSLAAIAGRDLNVISTTREQKSAHSSKTGIERVAGLYVTGDAGTLLASAGHDINLIAAALQNQGSGNTIIQAGNDVNLGVVTQSETDHTIWNSTNYRSESSQVDVGTIIQTQGDVTLQAGHDFNATGANVSSAAGALLATAVGDINLGASRSNVQLDEAHKYKDRGLLSSKTTTTHDVLDQTTAQATTLSAATATVLAGGNISVDGSNVASDNVTILAAGNDIVINAATHSTVENHFKATRKSGLFGSGFGFTMGTRQQSIDQAASIETAAASTVGSTQGSVTLHAEDHYIQTGSNVIAPQGDVSIAARAVNITETRETNATQVETRFKQSGLTVALSNPVISAVQTADRMQSATSHTTDARMQALAAGTTVLAAKNAVQAVQTNPQKMGGIDLSISIGSAKSQGNTTQFSDNAAGSIVMAGRDIGISATGAGEDSNLAVQGSAITAGRDVRLAADNQIELLAARNTASQHSTNRSKSSSLGISVGTSGLLVTASAGSARGHADGSDLAWSNTHVDAGRQVTMTSGGDTSLQGAVVRGAQVTADVDGDLNLQSLQDTSEFDSKQKSNGGSLSVGFGQMGATLNTGKSAIDSNFASVNEQTGLRAGDAGFQINVQGGTTLSGAQITSTQVAVTENRNHFQTSGTLTTTNLHNSAGYHADAVGVNLSAGATLKTDPSASLSGVGIGRDNGSAESTTTAGISSIAGDTNARTGDTDSGIQPIFDVERVQREIAAQVTITQEFNKYASQEIRNYAVRQRAILREQAKSAGTPEEKAELEKQIKDVNMQERALNIIVSAFTGMTGSVVTKEALSTAAEKMRDLMIEDSMAHPGVVDRDGNLLFSNASKESAGINGDEFGGAGTRTNLDLLCGADGHRCEFSYNTDGSIDKAKPITFIGELQKDGSYQTFPEFLQTYDGKKMLSAPFGGMQGWERTFFGITYPKGGWVDHLLESFSGPHDQIGGKWVGLYDNYGNTKIDRSRLTKVANEIWSGFALIPATPFAIAHGSPPEVWKAIVIFLGAAQ